MISKWLARRFRYTLQLEEEFESLKRDWLKSLERLSEQDQLNFLNKTGWLMPDTFGWDPEGWKKYQASVKRGYQ